MPEPDNGVEPRDPIIRTGDGSFTFRHPELEETYHSVLGAASEAEAKFILPSRLRDRLEQGPVRLLDIGFGLGINCRAALACDAPHGIQIDTVEKEPEALERALRIAPEDPLIQSLRDSGTYGPVHLHLGDLRHVLSELPPEFDVIFHDPFSPTKNTEAWTLDVFRLLRNLAAPEAVLVTYSESKVIRSALSLSGWWVGESSAHPPHRGGTMAALAPEFLEAPLDPASFLTEPYRDPDFRLNGKQIRAHREAVLRKDPSERP